MIENNCMKNEMLGNCDISLLIFTCGHVIIVSVSLYWIILF